MIEISISSVSWPEVALVAAAISPRVAVAILKDRRSRSQ
jgi:hypothetical protein